MSLSYLNDLNDQQRKAVKHEGSPLLVLAGAGAGKTRTLVYKAAYAITNQGVSPDRLLLVTFTNKAAGEMKDRIQTLVGATLPHVGTFHSIASRILRRDGKLIDISPSYVIYDQQDQLALVREVCKYLDIDIKRYKLRSLLAGISSAKQELLKPKDYLGIAKGPYQSVVAEVYSEYQKRLGKYGALDFDDLLLETLRLFQSQPEILERYQDLFSHIFVDEYQDTNTAQYLFTKLLAQKHKNLYVVGDASQSIYGWRGADYRNILKLRDDYANLTEIRLEQNYRSSQTILDAASGVISNNTTHPILTLWTESSRGEKIEFIEAYSAHDEANQVISRINRGRVSKGKHWSDFAILYRTNAQSRVMEEMLVKSSIPYILVGGIKFYERAEIKDVLSYLRLVYNPEDGVSRVRAEKLGKRRLANFDVAFTDYDYKVHGVSDILSRIYESTKYLDKYDETIEEDIARLENIKELDSLALEFNKLGDFLENVALVQAEYYAGEVDGPKEAVTLMTLHAAKGLEFSSVFMVGMEEGLFPHSRSMLDKEELEEERRLCYVGITRAKDKLYMTYAKKRLLYGVETMNVRSRFLDEIPSKLIETKTSQGAVRAPKTKISGIRIDALSSDTLEAFLDGEISVDELLSR